ncbi:MAG: helix-turn-helix transcriptional regulator [Chloroflexi bacterium]|nr:helix-turn-helix transcriptional regulator [Chloroflexota bacterium]
MTNNIKNYNQLNTPQPHPLSSREREVIDLLLQGKTNKQMAFILGISERTIEFHLKNIYTKFEVNSRVELVLKLWKSTGDNLGESTIDQRNLKTENRDIYTLLTSRIFALKNAVSIIIKEEKMKKRWFLYCLVGLVFGAAFWHYFSLVARIFNHFAGVLNLIPETMIWLLLPIFLFIYLGVWLIPAIVPAVYEFNRSSSQHLSVVAVITVCVSAVLGYYLNYIVMLAFFGLPHMEYFIIFGQHALSFWQDWNQLFQNLILYKSIKWFLISGFGGGIIGYLTTRWYSSLPRQHLNTI